MFEKEAVKERSEFSKELYEKIFSVTGKPKKILDIGCGLHPLHFPYKNIEYYACDVDKNVLRKVKNYFRKRKINGRVFSFDVNNVKGLKDLEYVDVVFVFKVLDILDRKLVRKFIENIKCKWLVVSFPTKTISGRRMKNPRRKWFEGILGDFKMLRYHNEIFYIKEIISS